MSIIGNNNQNVSTYVEKHKEQTANFYRFILSQYKALFNGAWKSAKYTPEEFFVEYGTDGKDLLALSAGLSALLLQASPSAEIPQLPNQYSGVSVAEDGTVTPVKAEASSSSSSSEQPSE